MFIGLNTLVDDAQIKYAKKCYQTCSLFDLVQTSNVYPKDLDTSTYLHHLGMLSV